MTPDRPRLTADDLRNFAGLIFLAVLIGIVLLGMTAVPETAR